LSGRSCGVAGKRTTRGLGSVYLDTDARSKTKWIAERWVTLPSGQRRRVRARGVTQDEALAALAVKASDTLARNPTGDRVTVREFMLAWLEHKQAHVRASTMRSYQQDNRLYITKYLGSHRLARLHASDCQQLIDRISAKGRKNMADRVRRTLKQALGYAVKQGALHANPMDRIDPVKKPDVERGTYDLEQITAFLEAASRSKLHPMFVLAFATGMRKGELLALKWSDVSADGVHVRRTVSKNAAGDGTTPPKTRAGRRFIPVDPEVMSYILSTRTRHAGDNEWVFTTRNGKRHSDRNVSKVMRDIQARHKLPEIRFHDFRRSYATLLAVQGHHPRVIQALLGHSTPTLAMTVYTEATEGAKRKARVDLRGSFRGLPSERDDTEAAGGKRSLPVLDANMMA